MSELLAEDELLLKNTVRDFADRELAPRAADHDESCEFPWDNIRGLANLGLFGLTIDEEYGGSGGTTPSPEKPLTMRLDAYGDRAFRLRFDPRPSRDAITNPFGIPRRGVPKGP